MKNGLIKISLIKIAAFFVVHKFLKSYFYSRS